MESKNKTSHEDCGTKEKQEGLFDTEDELERNEKARSRNLTEHTSAAGGPDVISNTTDELASENVNSPDLLSAPRNCHENFSDNIFANNTYVVMSSKLCYKEYSELKYENSITLESVVRGTENLKEEDSQPISTIKPNVANDSTTKNDENVQEKNTLENNRDTKDSQAKSGVSTDHSSSVSEGNNVVEEYEEETVVQIMERVGDSKEILEKDSNHSEFGLLEKTFLTLNRDDSPSDVESTKHSRVTMHDVNLIDSTSDGEDSESKEKNEKYEQDQKTNTLPRQLISKSRRVYNWLRGLIRRSTLIKKPRRRLPEEGSENPAEETKSQKYVFNVEVDNASGSYKKNDDAEKSFQNTL